jgi:hypothetical protein
MQLNMLCEQQGFLNNPSISNQRKSDVNKLSSTGFRDLGLSSLHSVGKILHCKMGNAQVCLFICDDMCTDKYLKFSVDVDQVIEKYEFCIFFIISKMIFVKDQSFHLT